jgi:AcrR family transcriptional regulator
MSIRERKQRQRHDLRSRILSTAEALFVQDGFKNVSMRKIARQIEYSPTTIYHYFKDKGELFGCLLEDYQGQLLARMNAIYARGDEPIVTLKKGMRAYTEFGLANPSFYKLAFMNNPEFKAEAYMAEGAKGTELFTKMQASVEMCIRLGLFGPIEPGLAAQVLWMMNHGVTSLLITNPNFPWADVDVLIDAVIDCTINGLRAGKGGAK